VEERAILEQRDKGDSNTLLRVTARPLLCAYSQHEGAMRRDLC